MDRDDQRALEFLRQLGSRPAVPFFEQDVARYVFDTLRGMNVDVRRDEYGNIIARYTSLPSGATSQPPIAFVAHMDHPGFEITEIRDDGAVARALGGVPVASLKKPTPALVLMPDGQRVSATLLPYQGAFSGSEEERLVSVKLAAEAAIRPPLPVVFDLPDFALDGDFIRMRALDDLAGCAASLAVLERLVSGGAEADVYAVFTRAEEGGLFGARLIAEAATLPRDTLVVSIESSAVIPGVAQGEGPVIRTGDRAYTFDADAEQVLIVARDTIRQHNSAFKCQRQLMSGGMCEATAFAVFGYKVTGMAFPLGNYHNATTSIPDPDGGVGAEYIRLSDFLGGVELLTEAARSVPRRGESRIRQYVLSIPDDARQRLRETAAP